MLFIVVLGSKILMLARHEYVMCNGSKMIFRKV